VIVCLLQGLPAAQGVLIERHVDAFPTELDSFHGEAQSLFRCSFAMELDLSSCADDALPWKAVGRLGAKQASDCAMVERIACGCGDFAVGGNLSFGYGANDATKGSVTRLVFAKAIFDNPSFDVAWNARWAAHGENVSSV